MNNEITAEQKKIWIFEALVKSGFERVNEMEIFTKEHDGKKIIVVDLTAGKSVVFKEGTTRISTDDEEGTLLNVSKIITDAEDGRMPTKSTPDEVVHVPKKDEPAQAPEIPKKDTKDNKESKDIPQGPMQNTTGAGNVPAVPDPAQACAPTELVHSTAPPAPFVPQGTMIKNLIPMLKEVGKIKIGHKGEMRKSQGGKDYRPPEKFDHFEIVTLYKDDKGDFIPDAAIMELIGNNAKELDVSLLYNDPSLNLFTRYAEYRGGKCLCEGDGETATNRATGERIKCNIDTCPKYASKKCKLNGILSVILKDAPQLGGVYKFRTTGINSVRSIMSSMFFIQSLTGGRLANIPLKMTIAPQTVNPIDSQTAQTIYVVNLIYPGTVDDLRKETLQLMTEQAGMHSKMVELEAQARVAISAPETKEEIQDVESEFYPDTVKEDDK